MSSERTALSDPRFRFALSAMVRKRVPESDVEDIVQSALAEALSSATAPREEDALRRWVWGVCRHKVVDFHRRARREKLDVPDVAADDVPHSERDLLRWAARELPPGKDAEETLEWLLREGDGEKLESIAESAKVPAPRVRQRVSRLRKHLRSRWAVEVAALAALGVLTAVVIWAYRREVPTAPIAKEIPSAAVPAPETPRELAVKERAKALRHCEERSWGECIDGLNRAQALDLSGDEGDAARSARAAAMKAMTPPPDPTGTSVPKGPHAPSITQENHSSTPPAPTPTTPKPTKPNNGGSSGP